MKKSANKIMHQSGKKKYNNMSKRSPSEMERSYKILQQQTLFHWVCSWELPMESIPASQGPQHGGHIG